jgi:hypothetical protein
MNLMPAVEAEIAVRLHDRRRLLAGGDEGEHGVRLGVLHALHVGDEVGVGQRDADAGHDLAAALLEGLDEGLFRLVAGREVAHRRVDALVFLGRPLAEGIGGLPERERHPREVRRHVRHVHARRVGADEGHLGLGGERGDGAGVRRPDDAGRELHLFAHDQLLRDALGVVGVRSGVVADDQLHLDAGRQLVAVELHEELEPLVELVALGAPGPL